MVLLPRCADLRAAPLLSLSYGLFTAILCMLMAFVAIRFGSYWLLFATLSGAGLDSDTVIAAMFGRKQ